MEELETRLVQLNTQALNMLDQSNVVAAFKALNKAHQLVSRSTRPLAQPLLFPLTLFALSAAYEKQQKPYQALDALQVLREPDTSGNPKLRIQLHLTLGSLHV